MRDRSSPSRRAKEAGKRKLVYVTGPCYIKNEGEDFDESNNFESFSRDLLEKSDRGEIRPHIHLTNCQVSGVAHLKHQWPNDIASVQPGPVRTG